MPAAQNVFEETEEDLDQPALLIEKANDFGGYVEEVRGDAQDAVAAGSGRAAPLLAALLMRRGLDEDQSDEMLGPVGRLTVLAHAHDGVERHLHLGGFDRQRTLLDD